MSRRSTSTRSCAASSGRPSYELADAGASLLVSTHVMDEAARCHELVLMRSGRIIATGSPAGLLERTQSDELEDAFVALAEAA